MQPQTNFVTLDFAETLINSFNGSAHLKELNNGKYVYSNQINAINLGFGQSNDVLGLTLWDINEYMHHNWGDMAARIAKFDTVLLKQQQKIINDRQVSLLPNGFVALHDMKKIPLHNRDGKVSWILTLSEQVTKNSNLIELYRLYLSLYKNNTKLAIAKFLSYLDAASLFYEQPTSTEIKILLLKQRYHTVKAIASKMSISPKTVACHLSNIRTKMTIDLTEFNITQHINT